MSEKKFLTVCIPTYNRSIVIGDLIDLLMYQVNKFGDCAVAVSDNSDNTLTEEIIKPFIEKYPGKIFYNRNAENIGPFRNLDKVARMVESEYIWFLSDDDFIFFYSVDKIRNFLTDNQDKDLSFISLNSCSMDSGLDFIGISNQTGCNKNKFYKSGDFGLFFEFSLTGIDHFSRLLFKQGVWIDYSDLSTVTPYNIYPQTNALIEVVNKYSIAFYSAITVIATKRKSHLLSSTTTWSGLGVHAWTKEIIELITKLEHYSGKRYILSGGEIKRILLAEWKMSLNRDAYKDIYPQSKQTAKKYVWARINVLIADIIFSNKAFRNKVKLFLIKKYNMRFRNE